MGFYRSKELFFICIGLLVVFLISSCKQPPEQIDSKKNTEQQHPKEGAIYHAPLLNNPSTLDPAYVQDQYGIAVIQQLFDGLVRFDPYLMVLPALAQTWQIGEDGKRYEFILQKNASFHNGEAVTAEDVVFSLTRLLRIDPSPAILPHLLKIEGAQAYRDHHAESVTGLKAINKHAVLIRLNEPYAPFLTALGMYQAKIVPEAEVVRSEESFGHRPVGSGPFQFVSWRPDERIQLKGFQQYFADKPLLDEVWYRIYPGGDLEQIVTDFRNGTLDEMPVLGDIRNQLSAKKDLQWFHRPALSLVFYGMRLDHSPLNTPEFRRKLSAAIDRENLIREVYNNQFEPAERILPPGMPGVNLTAKKFTHNLDTPHSDNRITNDQGEQDKTIPLEIVSGSKSAFARAELDFVRQAWAKLGIKLEVKYITDWSAFEAYINSEKVQIYRYAWFADMPDPDSFFYPLFTSGSPANFMKFRDENINNLIVSARGESDPGTRTEMYHEIESLIIKSMPIIPLFHLSVDRVYKSYVQGAQPSALGAHYMPLHRVWLKRGTPTQ